MVLNTFSKSILLSIFFYPQYTHTHTHTHTQPGTSSFLCKLLIRLDCSLSAHLSSRILISFFCKEYTLIFFCSDLNKLIQIFRIPFFFFSWTLLCRGGSVKEEEEEKVK